MNAWKEEAKDLLAHYLKLATPHHAMNDDNIAEIHSIVDLIVDAAVVEVRAAIAAAEGRGDHG